MTGLRSSEGLSRRRVAAVPPRRPGEGPPDRRPRSGRPSGSLGAAPQPPPGQAWALRPLGLASGLRQRSRRPPPWPPDTAPARVPPEQGRRSAARTQQGVRFVLPTPGCASVPRRDFL